MRESWKLEQANTLIKGVEKERKRVAQDLHDSINGDLSMIKYKMSDLATKRISVNKAGEIINMLDKSIEQVRRISHNLMPVSLEQNNLIVAIQEYCEKISGSSNVDIHFQIFGTYSPLPDETEKDVYRIIMELINNMAKHSRSK